MAKPLTSFDSDNLYVNVYEKRKYKTTGLLCLTNATLATISFAYGRQSVFSSKCERCWTVADVSVTHDLFPFEVLLPHSSVSVDYVCRCVNSNFSSCLGFSMARGMGSVRASTRVLLNTSLCR